MQSNKATGPWLLFVTALVFTISLSACGNTQSSETPVSFPEFTRLDTATLPLHFASIDDLHLFEDNVTRDELKPLPKTFNAAVNAPPYQDTLWAWCSWPVSGGQVLIYAGRQGNMALHFYAVIQQGDELLPKTVKQLTAFDEEEGVVMEAWIEDFDHNAQPDILQKEIKVTELETHPVAEHIWTASGGKWVGMGVGERDDFPLWCGPGFTAMEEGSVYLPAFTDWLKKFESGYRSSAFWSKPILLNGMETERFPEELSFCPDLRLRGVWREPEWNAQERLGLSVEQHCSSQPVDFELEILRENGNWRIAAVNWQTAKSPVNGKWEAMPQGKSSYEFARLHWFQPPGDQGRWERELLQLSIENESGKMEGELFYQGTSHSISRWSLMQAPVNLNRPGNYYSFYLTPVNEDGEEIGISKPVFFHCAFQAGKCVVMENSQFIPAGTTMRIR